MIPSSASRDDGAPGLAGGSRTPRRRLAELVPSSRTAAAILDEQNDARVPELIPLRMERMLADPFAFFRGTAAVMAADLAGGPSSGIDMVSCGDAHLLNFGVYAAPDRSLVFDVNDFDEVAVAPAEWDLKRFATSVIVGARQYGHDERRTQKSVDAALTGYRDALRRSVRCSPLERYYARLAPERVTSGSKGLRRLVGPILTKARGRTSEQAFRRLVETDTDGQRRIRDDGTVTRRISSLDVEQMRSVLDAYRRVVPVDVAYLLTQYEPLDFALRIVGVGSVGTRCYVAVLLGPDDSPLILQIKEASVSVLETYGGRSQPDYVRERTARFGQGGRVVAGQRVMQAASDVFLGSLQYASTDYYVRQFRDMKGSIDAEALTPGLLAEYSGVCAQVLAAAHARSPRAAEFAAYLGEGRRALDAISEWSRAYADKSRSDFEAIRAERASTQRSTGSASRR